MNVNITVYAHFYSMGDLFNYLLDTHRLLSRGREELESFWPNNHIFPLYWEQHEQTNEQKHNIHHLDPADRFGVNRNELSLSSGLLFALPSPNHPNPNPFVYVCMRMCVRLWTL